MADWNEKMLDEELEAIMNDVPEQEDLEKKINQIINRRIRKVVMKTLSIVTAIVLVLYLGISPLMNAVFWNPYEMNKDGELLKVMRNYFDMTKPWYEVANIDVEKKGFANYEVEMTAADMTLGGHGWDRTQTVHFEISKGFYKDSADPGHVMQMYCGRFQEIDFGSSESTIENIEELPESAVVALSLSSKDVKTVEELRETNLGVDWIQVYQPEAEFQGGIRLYASQGVAVDEPMRWTMSGEELLQVYLENLENLLEHPEVWREFQLSDGRNSVYVQGVEVLRDTYENAKELETVVTKNYCILGQRDEVLEHLYANEFTNIDIENVMLSWYE